MNCIEDPKDNKGAIYVGSLESANDTELLKKNKIRAVLTVASGTGLAYTKDHDIHEHLILPADDTPAFDISKHFETGIDFIERNRRHTNVLVHCHAGISRSSTIVIAYLMKTKGWKFERALTQARKRREIICPNPGFQRHLQTFERRLNTITSNENKNAFTIKGQQKELIKEVKEVKEDTNKLETRPESKPEGKTDLSRFSASVAKKPQTAVEKPDLKSFSMVGNSFLDRKNIEQKDQKPLKDQKQPLKSSSVSKQTKPNYHFSVGRSDFRTPLNDKGPNFSKALNMHRGQYLGSLINRSNY